jgi:PEGA domain
LKDEAGAVMHAAMKLLASAFAIAVACVASGCAHTVNMTSEPAGAEVYLNGQKLGTTPFAYEEKSAGSGKVELVAKQGGKEKKVSVDRNQLAMNPILAGAGAGAGACLAINAVGCLGWFVIGFFAAPVNLVGCLALPAGAGVGWFMFGNQMPDTVKIEMTDAAPAASASPGAPPPSAAY